LQIVFCVSTGLTKKISGSKSARCSLKSTEVFVYIKNLFPYIQYAERQNGGTKTRWREIFTFHSHPARCHYLITTTDMTLSKAITHQILQLKENRAKAVPVQAWTGPGVSRSLRLSDFETKDT